MSSTAFDPQDENFERLYRRHARDVYRFVLAVVRNPHEAEDVTQTAFLNAYRAYQRGERPERPHSWLIAIAHNAIRSRHRFKLRRPREVPFDETALDLPVAAEERETVAEVLQALGELPENQREALAMRELEGRSYQEIAETLGVTVPAVESLVFRARRTLRRQRTSLRGLTLVQLPRSLRTLFQTQPGAVTAGLAAKAAVIVAAAGVVAGGILGSTDAGASQHPIPSGRHEPSRPQIAAPQRAHFAAAAVVLERGAVQAGASTRAARRTRRPGAPPAAPALPPPPGVDVPSVMTRIGPASDAATGAPTEAPRRVPAPGQIVTAATKTVPLSVPVRVPLPHVPVKPPVPVKAPLPVPTPRTVPSVPAVTVPTPPPAPVPAPPSVPTVPSLPPPPAVTVPQPPGIPQVPGPTGIK